MRTYDSTPGWVNRELATIKRQIREMRAEKRLARSSFAGVAPGAIPLSVVANSSAPGYVNLTATNFALALAGSYLIDSPVTVPDGMTSCVVSLTGRVYAANTTLAVDYLYANVEVNGVTSSAVPMPADVAGARDEVTLNVSPLATVLTGLTAGATFPVRLHAATATADWTADTGNTADLSGLLAWFS